MYCERDDLLTGDMPLPLSAEGFIQAATDEIDSVLGVSYVIPLDMTTADPTASLTLKRIAALLASGRLILAQATGTEDDGVHAYGMYLLREGKELLARVNSGEFPLIGVPPRVVEVTGNTPRIIHEDSISAVDAFYAMASRGQLVAFVPGDLNEVST